jgi:protein-L-isoaspartate(D-aspartate) O-methyltransferase
VLEAMREIPREEFVPAESRLMAYQDEPIPIGHGQTISQPYMTALMAESLELAGTETVLEVGAGSGYAAAVLGTLAARVDIGGDHSRAGATGCGRICGGRGATRM